MSDLLKYEQYIQDQCDTLEDGETKRINHITCSAGEDTRQRLYLSKPHHGGRTALAFCHNCQKGRAFTVGAGYRVPHGPLTTEASKYPDPMKVNRPIDITDYEPYSNAPTDVRAHVFKHGLTTSIATEMCLRYDPATHRLVFPIYDHIMMDDDGVEYGTLKGVQLKKMHGHGTKYITCMSDETHEMFSLIKYFHPTSEFAINFVVEDYLSACKLIQWGLAAQRSVTVLCNYGTKVNSVAINHIPHGQCTIVWLDNDSPHVLAQATRIEAVANLLHPKVTTVVNRSYSDPKNSTYEQIGEVVSTWTA